MGKEVNINLGDKSSKEKGRSCFDGVCPPNPFHVLDGIESALPMILGLGLTFLKMDQFNRPLANTAMQMIEGLAPQIEKNAMKFGAVINSLSEASHNVAAKVSKHPDDFTKEDKVHLVQMLINDENNYFDSYDSALDFLSYQNPGFVKALYKTLMANMPKDGKQIVHANSREGKNNIEKNSDPDRKPVSTDRYTDLHDNLLDDHIAKAKQGLALSTVGLEGKGLFNSPAAAEFLKNNAKINTDKPNEELSENVARLNRKAKIDDAAASKSLTESVEGAKETLDKDKMTPQKVRRLNELKSKKNLDDGERKEKKELEDRKKQIDEKHKKLADVDPTKDSIASAKKEITDNSAKSKATLASEKATRAEAEVKAAKENVKVAQAKLDDANEKFNTAESVKNTAQNAVDNTKNMDAELKKDLETKLLDAVKAEGNAKEQVQKLTSALKEAEATAEAEAAKAEAADAAAKAAKEAAAAAAAAEAVESDSDSKKAIN